MANRRKFLAGIGALASGSAAAVGTGAFTAVQADRSLTVDVESDSGAFLGIEATSTAGSVVTVSNGQVSLNFEDGESGNDYGLNPNARTVFQNVLRVTNNGSDDIHVGVDDSAVDGNEDGTGLSGIKRMAVQMVDGNPSLDTDYSNGATRIDNNPNVDNGGNSAVDFSTTPPSVSRPNDSNSKLGPGESALLTFVFITDNNPPTSTELESVSITFAAATPDSARTN